ncbi:YiiX/YebB-like N1pC/P60 family cysteine hydrolase, partial [Flavobacteriales bacterium]|nr:YiiX/YebB-like N1pC/P60 family cysteine hydrolase [Flavobacteriales bacterium]
IELVTPGYKDANFSHIGLVVLNNDTLKVLEAIPPKVVLTDIKSFFNRSYDTSGSSKIIAGRLKDEFQHTIKYAIIYAKSKIGIKYDEAFLMNNKSYYCSELIFEAFEKDSIFKLKPMTFLHPETNDTLTVWKNYYSKLGVTIPQNEPGINPGIMSLSDKIEMIYFYGIPDGMKQ